MKARVNKDTTIEEAIKSRLQEVYTAGLKVGCKAFVGVVLEKAENRDGLPCEDVLKDIIEFCERSLGIREDPQQDNNTSKKIRKAKK